MHSRSPLGKQQIVVLAGFYYDYLAFVSIKTNWTSLDFIFKTMMCVNLMSSTLVIGGQLCNGIISLFSTSLFWKTKSCPIS